MKRLAFIVAGLWLGILVQLPPALGDAPGLGNALGLGETLGNDSVGAGAQSRGARALTTGQFEQAIAAWSDALRQARAAGDRMGETDALIQQAHAYQELGHVELALANLRQARELARQAGGAEQ